MQVNRRVGVAFAIGAVILNCISSLFWFYKFDSWTFHEVLQTHAYITGEFASIWSSQNYANVTTELWYSFEGIETSATTWCMGAGGLLMSFVGRLQDYILCDVTVMIALSLYQAMSNCVRLINVKELQTTQMDIWCEYNYMQELAQKINGVFGPLLLLIHVNNGLMISHFLLQSLNQDMGIATMLLGVTVAKVLMIYYLAMQTSEAVCNNSYFIPLVHSMTLIRFTSVL